MEYLVKKHINPDVYKKQHYRVLFPIGQGGFAFEHIDGYSVVYDCGSVTAPTRVKQYVEVLREYGVTKIDCLLLSHYDKDHVNGVKYMMNSLQVRMIFAPHIPTDLHIVYDVATRNAYSELRNLAKNRETELIEVSDEARHLPNIIQRPVWEWITKSMLSQSDFSSLRKKLSNHKLDLNRLENDRDYAMDNKEAINDAFKQAFGPSGPNAKGLIMLSQKRREATFVSGHISNNHCCHLHLSVPPQKRICCDIKSTSCLYLGDAVLKGNTIVDIQSFLTKHNADKPLSLMQIPHHGSKYNFSLTIDSKLPSEYYFICDKDENRIQNCKSLYNRLISNYNLFFVRDVCSDLVVQESEVY